MGKFLYITIILYNIHIHIYVIESAPRNLCHLYHLRAYVTPASPRIRALPSESFLSGKYQMFQNKSNCLDSDQSARTHRQIWCPTLAGAHIV